MASRANDWYAQAERDLDYARMSCDVGYHEWACFAAQQAAEKAVKAVYQQGGAEARGHSIKALLENLPDRQQATDDLTDCGRILDHYYIPTRYPNGFDTGMPADYFTEKESDEAIRCADTILRFCHDRLFGPTSGD
ncbi:MAG TPA: HEPN domain-containing protein [bacterium]|nr:HEPN domain-containing protein [bacterium]